MLYSKKMISQAWSWFFWRWYIYLFFFSLRYDSGWFFRYIPSSDDGAQNSSAPGGTGLPNVPRRLRFTKFFKLSGLFFCISPLGFFIIWMLFYDLLVKIKTGAGATVWGKKIVPRRLSLKKKRDRDYSMTEKDITGKIMGGISFYFFQKINIHPFILWFFS